MVSAFFVALVFAVIGLALGTSRGRPMLGFILGGLFSLIGIVILLVLEPTPGSTLGRERRLLYKGEANLDRLD